MSIFLVVEILQDKLAATLPREQVRQPGGLLCAVLEQALEQDVRGERVLEGAVLLLRVPAERLQDAMRLYFLRFGRSCCASRTVSR